MTPTETVRRFWEILDSRTWDDLYPVLAPDLLVSFPHTGEVLRGAEQFVEFQRQYPGVWRIDVVESLAEGGTVASRATVSDGVETYHVAAFHTVADDRITGGVEYWISPVEPAADRRP